MNVLLVAMLAGLWLWLLSPGVLRDRRPRSPIASIDSFERYMDTLAPLPSLPAPGPQGAVHRAPHRRPAAQRRRLVLTRLTVTLMVTFGAAMTFGGWSWSLPAISAVLLASYLAALAAFQRRAELHARVRRLPTRDGAAEGEVERRVREA